jgi:hypothetical protein
MVNQLQPLHDTEWDVRIQISRSEPENLWKSHDPNLLGRIILTVKWIASSRYFIQYPESSDLFKNIFTDCSFLSRSRSFSTYKFKGLVSIFIQRPKAINVITCVLYPRSPPPPLPHKLKWLPIRLMPSNDVSIQKSAITRSVTCEYVSPQTSHQSTGPSRWAQFNRGLADFSIWATSALHETNAWFASCQNMSIRFQWVTITLNTEN